jgi:heptosyltransferase III
VRILVINLREIGDLLLATPLLRSLRRAWPQACLDVLTFCGREGIVRSNPDINNILSIPLRASKAEQWALLKKIARRYDLALSTQSGDRPLLYALAAASRRLALVPPKHPQNAWKRWICQAWRVADEWDTHVVRQNLWLAQALAIPSYFSLVPPPAQNLDNFGDNEDFAVLHLTPRWTYKRWTIPGWVQTAAYLRDSGLRIVLTGSDNDEENGYLAQALPQLPSDTLNLAGRLNFNQVTTLLQRARVYLGPDTVVTHLAAAIGTPTVALYGPTNPLKWSPWPVGYEQDRNPFALRGPLQRNGNVVLIQGDDACVPCHQEGCERHRHSDSRCLTQLRADTVIAALASLHVRE